MLKFVHKKHINKNPNTKALIIYYSLSDIILGLLLVTLVAFFIYNYLEFSFNTTGQNDHTLTTENKLNMPLEPIKK